MTDHAGRRLRGDACAKAGAVGDIAQTDRQGVGDTQVSQCAKWAAQGQAIANRAAHRGGRNPAITLAKGGRADAEISAGGVLRIIYGVAGAVVVGALVGVAAITAAPIGVHRIRVTAVDINRITDGCGVGQHQHTIHWDVEIAHIDWRNRDRRSIRQHTHNGDAVDRARHAVGWPQRSG